MTGHATIKLPAYRRRSGWLCLFMLTAWAFLCLCPFSHHAFAQGAGTDFSNPDSSPNTDDPGRSCLTGADYDNNPPPGQGILTKIIMNIQGIVSSIMEHMFDGIVTNPGFYNAALALITLYVAVFGIFFMFGMAELTVSDFAGRGIKIGIIVLLLSPNAWTFFNNTVVQFVNAGLDDFIYNVIENTAYTAGEQTGGQETGAPVDPEYSGSNGTSSYNAPPFYIVDPLLTRLVSTKMGVTLLALNRSGPYGLILGLILGLSVGSLLKALLTLTWVYLMSLVVRALLFGLAPIFLSFMLFSRTRNLFDGWFNQLANAWLQVAFLFIFDAWFIALVEGAVFNIYVVPVCFESTAQDIKYGTASSGENWGFMVQDPKTREMEMFHGIWTWEGPSPAPKGYTGPITPISPLNILLFLLLTELFRRFNNTVLAFASDLAQASTSFASMKGAAADWTSPSAGSDKSAVAKVPSRIGPTGRQLRPAAQAALKKVAQEIGKTGIGNASGNYTSQAAADLGKREGGPNGPGAN